MSVGASWSTEQVLKAIRERFGDGAGRPRYAVFEEVRNGAGFDATRSCDAMVMELWPSDGLNLHGFEVKVSRSDWLRELKDPAKADALMAVCDHWWLVAGSREIVKDGELPEGWGLMVPRGVKLVVAKQAPKLSPIPLDRGTLASLLRRSIESKASVAELAEARKRGFEEGKRDREWDFKNVTRDLEELREGIAKFERASGVKINSWDGGRIGQAVRAVLNAGVPDAIRDLKWQEERLSALLSSVREVREVLEVAHAD